MTAAQKADSRRPSLQWRLMSLIMGIILVALLVASASIINNGREAIRAEGDSFAEFSLQMLEHAIKDYFSTPFSRQDIDWLITSLNSMRHVKVVRLTENQSPDDILQSGIMANSQAPYWFSWLMLTGQEQFYRVIVDTGTGSDQLLVVTNPADEIDEVWADIEPLIWLTSVSVFLMCLFIYLAVRHSLLPLSDLSAGFQRLERGDFSEPVREDVVRELYHIHQRFNWMSRVLQETMQDNSELAARMVVLREEERMHLARELHDELSPYMFNIKMHLATTLLLLEKMSADIPVKKLRAISEMHADMEQGVRRMLNRLRPAVLDEHGLEVTLHDLVKSWCDHMTYADWTIETGGDLDSLDHTLKVTTFRIVRECLTNVAKHSDASRVEVRVIRTDSNNTSALGELHITVTDNGKGMQPGGRPGFGLRGMKERVKSLGGKFDLNTTANKGFCVEMMLPIRAETDINDDSDMGDGSEDMFAEAHEPGIWTTSSNGTSA